MQRLQRLLRHNLRDAPQPPAPLLDADKALITSVRRCLFDFDAAAAELGLQPDECRLRWADLDQRACATLATSLGQSLGSPDVAEVEVEASSFNVFTSRSLNAQMTELFAEARAALPSMNGVGSGSDDDDDDGGDAKAVVATDVRVEDLEEEEEEPQPQQPQQRTPPEAVPVPPRPTQPPPRGDPRARGRGAMFAEVEEVGGAGDESEEDEEAWHARQRQARRGCRPAGQRR